MTDDVDVADIVVIGAGVVGLSVAAELSQRRSVIVLERSSMTLAWCGISVRARSTPRWWGRQCVMPQSRIESRLRNDNRHDS